MPVDQWLEIHDRLVAFRRELSRSQGFRMRSELKATQIVSRGGAWRRASITERTRLGVYKRAIGELAAMAPVVRVLAVVIPDRHDPFFKGRPAVAVCWDVLLERLERFCFYTGSSMLVAPDDGAPLIARGVARRRRRFGYVPSAFGGPSRSVPFRQLVDDPITRDSASHYLMQWADLVAYAAFRRVVPRADFPTGIWDLLSEARLGEANAVERSRRHSAEPPGLIVWPSRWRPVPSSSRER